MLRDNPPKVQPTGDTRTQVSKSTDPAPKNVSGSGNVSSGRPGREAQKPRLVEVVTPVLNECLDEFANKQGQKQFLEPRVRHTLVQFSELMFDGHSVDEESRKHLREELQSAKDAIAFRPTFLEHLAKVVEGTHLDRPFTEAEFLRTKRMMDNAMLLINAYAHLLWHGNMPVKYWKQFREPAQCAEHKRQVESSMSGIVDDIMESGQQLTRQKGNVLRRALKTTLREYDKKDPLREQMRIALRWTGDFSQAADPGDDGGADDMAQ